MTKVLILGGDADHNLGDAAILESTCVCLRKADKSAEITAVSDIRVPGSLPGLHQVVPTGVKGFARLLSAARRQDLVIIGGGGLFQDDDSRIKMPYWGLRTLLMACADVRIVGHSIGAGPLSHWESRLFARLACAMMSRISVRDQYAQGWLSACTGKPIEVVPDPAFTLQPAAPEAAQRIIAGAGITKDRIIGVALRRWFHHRGILPHQMRVQIGLDNNHGGATMARLITELSRLLERLAKTHDASILLMPSYNLDHEGDTAVCSAIAANLRGKTSVGLANIGCAADYKAVTGKLMLLLAARMHPLIFAASMGTPIVGLAYNAKFDGMFKQLGMPSRMIWLDEFRDGNPIGKIERLTIEAMGDATDYKFKARTLADLVSSRTAELLSERAGVTVPSM